jgi:hypothetical protein
LIAGDTASAINRIDDEITALKRAERTERDRITLLTKQAEREEREGIARRRAATIARVETKLAEADALADELQAGILKNDQLFRRIVRIREDCRPVFSLGDSHINASINNHEGAALSAPAIVLLLRHDLYRVGARPFAGGTSGAHVEPSWPGGLCPRLEWQLQPDRITPLSTALRNASAFAISLLRGKETISIDSPPDPQPTTPEQITTTPKAAPVQAAAEQPPSHSAPQSNGAQSESRLAVLLKAQSDLASDPAREAEYMAVVQQIAALTEGA